MSVRLALVGDIPEMHRVRMSVHENRLDDPARVRPADYRSMIRARGRGWVCEVDGRIVGFAVADLVARNVWALFIEPASERRGLGRQLHDIMMDWMFAEGASSAWLTTAPGTRAEGFYRAAGWQYVGPEPSGEARYEMTSGRWLGES